MLKIASKTQLDFVTQIPMVNAHMQWYLLAVEEVVGWKVLNDILHELQLDELIHNYPEDNLMLSSMLKFQDYSNINALLLQYFGDDKCPEIIQIGRISARHALKKQGKVLDFGVKQALKLLPISVQIKAILESMQNDLNKLYQSNELTTDLMLQDRRESWAYIDFSCALCAGKTSNTPMCGIWNGSIQESLNWLTGKEFMVNQVACRATHDPACIWEVDKIPL